MADKDLAYYRALPYTRRAIPAVDHGTGERHWIAEIVELPGCRTDGPTRAAAMVNLDSLFDDYITAKLGWNAPIPEPVRERHAPVTVTVPDVNVTVVQQFAVQLEAGKPNAAKDDWSLESGTAPKSAALAGA